MVSQSGIADDLPLTTRRGGFVARALTFVGIGLILYILLLLVAEDRVRGNGERNPLFLITQMGPESDVIVLGASHAMPLGFEGIDSALETASGREVTTLAIEGGGIVPADFLLDAALRQTRPAQVIYVVDSFAFLSRQWNEDRIADQELFARAPFNGTVLAATMSEPAARPMLPWYLSGFDKVNSLFWPEPDRSEAELTKFERTHRPNDQIDTQRVAYLFPDAPAGMVEDYVGRLEGMAEQVEAAGAEFILLLLPVPARYTDRLPPAHDDVMDRIAEMAETRGVEIVDHSGLLQEDENYYDTDHLNRTGATAYVTGPLADLLSGRP